MTPELALCSHLGTEAPRRLAIPCEDILESHDGPVIAALRCPRCGGAALLELLDWSLDRRVRIYSLAALAERDLGTFLRNTRRGSCDPNRWRRELEALLACAGPRELLLALDQGGGRVLRAAARPPELRIPAGPWEGRLPDPADTLWFAALGLEKGGGICEGGA